ncbi:MAG: metal ABC transporter permease [Actinobacteria bacterium]|nr:metal ABC transporter permease [Actinomycetota bacterium]
MIARFVDPWSIDLVRLAALEVVLAGVVCGAIGAFVVVRGLAYAGEAFAHTVFPGAVIAVAVGAPIGLGALVSALVATLAVGVVQRRTLAADGAIGIVLVGALGLGAILLSRVGGAGRSLESFLFGTPLGADRSDLRWTLLVASIIVAGIAVGWRALVATTFDTDAARGIGVRPGVVNALLLVGVALAVVIALRAVGSLLTLALLVTPAATARLVARRMAGFVVAGAAIGGASAFAGIELSAAYGIAAGASIVLVAGGVFVATLAGQRGARALRGFASGQRQAAQRP